MKRIGKQVLLVGCALQLLGQTAQHVVVFGVDGLSPRGITETQTPAMHQLMKEGVWTLQGRAVIPTVSSPNWGAMIMGAAPDLTGITSNDWQPNKFEIAPACSDAPGIYPTIFGILRKSHPDAKIGIFTDWPDFVRMVEPGVADEVVKPDEKAPEVVQAALAYISKERPLLAFIHLDIVDEAGHKHNWYGPEYDQAVRQTDGYLAQVRAALEQAGMAKDTVLLLIADHGGHDKKHGAMQMSDIEIPWVAVGPGIPANREIKPPLSTTQTAPTIARWLGVSPDSCWIAPPVALATGMQTSAGKKAATQP